jgi:hypothetical protein
MKSVHTDYQGKLNFAEKSVLVNAELASVGLICKDCSTLAQQLTS